MILRKPYAFFIKHFRLFHFIMFVFLGLISYRTNLVRSFFNEYLTQVAYVIPENIAAGMFSNLTYIWALIVILFSIIVFVVMNKKEKPVLFYGLNILVVFSTIVFLIYSQTIVYRLQSELIAVTILRAVRDISNILFLIQAVFLIMTFVRAIGFDIKKFDFKRDLEKLNISEEDSEEYEVQFNFDRNELKRNFRKSSREFKYFLLENKKMIILFSVLFIFVVALFVYFNFLKFSKSHNINEFFTTNDLTMKVTNSYITQNSYKQTKLTDNFLVVVSLEFKMSSNTLNTSKTQLKVGDGIYYPTISKYNENLIDIGTVYNSEKLTNEVNKYILVYEIPEALKDKKMTFIYLDNYSRTLFGEKYKAHKVNLNPISLDDDSKAFDYNYQEKLEFNNDFIKGNLVVMNYEIKDLFVTKYNTCIKKDECYDLNEYLQPSFSGYEDKTILKLNATLNYDDSSIVKENLFDLISKYGEIRYIVDNKEYTTKDIKSTNFSISKDNNNYYAEVPKSLEKATNIDLVFNIRNYKYVYTIK